MGTIGSTPEVSTREHERTQVEAGRIILVDGTSSAGKSTLCRSLQETLPAPFRHYSSDHFIEAGMRPRARLERGEFRWSDLRPRFFDGFHRTVPAFAAGGNDLLVEHVVEEPEWAEQLRELLEDLDVFVVSVRCPPGVAAERERNRGDRAVGEAAYHARTYELVVHDLEVDSTRPAAENARLVTRLWRNRKPRRGLP